MKATYSEHKFDQVAFTDGLWWMASGGNYKCIQFSSVLSADVLSLWAAFFRFESCDSFQ